MLVLLSSLPCCLSFAPTTTKTTTTTSLTTTTTRTIRTTTTNMSSSGSGGDGSESEWSKALNESKGRIPGQFDLELAKQLLEKSNTSSFSKKDDEKEEETSGSTVSATTTAATSTTSTTSTSTGKKMSGLNPNAKSTTNAKLSANAKLISWLETQGDVYLSDASGWGEAPHPMAISTDTVDELTNESSGRGLLARRNINQEEVLLTIPISLCITKESARETFDDGKILPPSINEYLAMATQLIHERFVLNEKSFYKPYLDVLPLVNEVNPTFTWSEDDLNALTGSPVVAATQSMQMKLKREFEDLLSGEGKLCDQYPDLFPREVRMSFYRRSA